MVSMVVSLPNFVTSFTFPSFHLRVIARSEATKQPRKYRASDSWVASLALAMTAVAALALPPGAACAKLPATRHKSGEATMRLISYREKNRPGIGVMVDDERFVALPKAAPDLPRDMRALIEMEDGFAKAAAAAKGRMADLRLGDVTLDPVVPVPNAIWCLALNYKLHINETGLTT